MNETSFTGQQEGEIILYVIHPHPLSKYLKIASVLLLSVFFYLFLQFLSTAVPVVSSALHIGAAAVSVLLALGGTWWNITFNTRTRTYITNRRIMRFEAMTPFVTTKRALFWNEALKAKGYAPNLPYRLLNIGTLEVDPVASGYENVRVTDVYYFEDLANYIDKCIFTFKNSPAAMDSIKPFVPMPKGKRD